MRGGSLAWKAGWTPLTIAEGVFYAGTFKRQVETASLLRRLMEGTEELTRAAQANPNKQIQAWVADLEKQPSIGWLTSAAWTALSVAVSAILAVIVLPHSKGTHLGSGVEPALWAIEAAECAIDEAFIDTEPASAANEPASMDTEPASAASEPASGEMPEREAIRAFFAAARVVIKLFFSIFSFLYLLQILFGPLPRRNHNCIFHARVWRDG